MLGWRAPFAGDALATGRPPRPDPTTHDDEYFALIAKALRVCANYKPMFGQGRKGGLTLEQFHRLYGADPFYAWVGLDSPLMYAAHKAAGGMTSIYRQLGIGCEWVFGRMLQNSLGLTEEQARWKYEVRDGKGLTRTLYLDGRIELAHIRDADTKRRLSDWMNEAAEWAMVPAPGRARLRGAVFEVRQGYKSKDSKRQNADIGNAASAYAHDFLPVLFILSKQIDSDVLDRYQKAQWLPLVGTTAGTPTGSGYVFCREIVGYDLASFFERNSTRLKFELEIVLKKLMEP